MKCLICKKKIPFLLKCKCGSESCVSCLDPLKHNCPRNLHIEHKMKLQKQLIQVIPDKLQKI